jgi:orotate phosphoribosyltransferase
MGDFLVKGAGVFSGKKIVLIDVVITTGATLRAASAALKAAGAVEVVALTLARVPRQDTAGRLPGQYVEPGLTMSVASSEGAAARGGITDDGFGPTA